jgi:hypothetical protein
MSRDGGRTFSPPARVSEDHWMLDGCPDDGPTMALDRDGVVHVVWPTLVQGAQPAIGLFHASMRDSVTFTPRQRIETLDGKELFYRNGLKVLSAPVVPDVAFRVLAPRALFEGGFDPGSERAYDVAPDGRFVTARAGVDAGDDDGTRPGPRE